MTLLQVLTQPYCVPQVKIRHILERTIRRFGYDHIIQYTTDLEDGYKILANIKKRRERAKRKKAAATAEGGNNEVRFTRTHR